MNLPSLVDGMIPVRGVVEFDQQLIAPVDSLGRLSHWGIAGQGVGGELRWKGDPAIPAIVIKSLKMPNQYGRLSADVRLQDFALVGGSIVIQGGGKYVKTRNLEVVSCPVTVPAAFSVSDYDDGDLDVNVHDCAGNGIALTNCHAGYMRLTARVCGGTGISMSNCRTAVNFNSEANGGYDLDLDGVSCSLLFAWNEQAWYGQHAPPTICQARRRNCWGNLFLGMTQAESWNAWDDDQISRVANRDMSEPGQFGLGQIGTQLNIVPLVGKPRNYGANQVQTDGTNWTVFKNAFAPTSFPPGSTLPILDFTDPTGTLDSAHVSKGDWLIFSGTLSSPDWQYLRTCKWPLLRFTATAGGGQTTLGQNIWVTQPDAIRFVTAPVQVTQSGKGVRLFAYLAPNNGGVGPTQDLRFSLSSLSVRVVRG